MIVRTPERPIRNDDIEVGSLVTVKSSKGKPVEYMILTYKKKDKKTPVISGLRIVPVGEQHRYAFYLYADKAVLLLPKQVIHLSQIETVRARLAIDIVQNIKNKHSECKQRIATKQKQAEQRAKMYKHTSSLSPKGSTNTAWGSLKYASNGYIHIYRG